MSGKKRTEMLPSDELSQVESRQEARNLAEARAEYVVAGVTQQSASERMPPPILPPPLEDFTEDELRALFAEFAEEDVALAEEGLAQYAARLRETDEAG